MRRVERVLSSSAAPVAVGAGRSTLLRRRSSLRLASSLRPLSTVEAGGLESEPDRHLGLAGCEVGGEHVRVIGDVGAVDPARAGLQDREISQLLLGTCQECISLDGCGVTGRSSSWSARST